MKKVLACKGANSFSASGQTGCLNTNLPLFKECLHVQMNPIFKPLRALESLWKPLGASRSSEEPKGALEALGSTMEL